MPGDCTSVSTTPTRRPWAAASVATFAVILDFPVPPRNEWTETILATVSSLLSTLALQAKVGHFPFQRLEVVGLRDFLDLPGRPSPVDLDAQLSDLALETLLAGHALAGHPADDPRGGGPAARGPAGPPPPAPPQDPPGEVPQFVAAPPHRIQAPGVERSRLHGSCRFHDVAYL